MAETQGAKVEFILPRLTTIAYQGLRAFIAPAANLWFVQRREFFRVSALHPAYFYAEPKMPDKRIRFRLFDLSLGGMGALMDAPKPEGLVEGRFSQLSWIWADGRFWLTRSLIAISRLSGGGQQKRKPLPPRD